MVKSKIQQLVNKIYKLIYAIAHWFVWKYYKYKDFFLFNFPNLFRIWLRRHKLLSNNKYAIWNNFKDIHKGERCFIVATGPSLTFEDLHLIKNEYSFGVNSIVKILSKTDWRPTYYGIQDKFVYAKLKQDIINSKLYPIFIGHTLKKQFKPVSSYIPYFNYVNNDRNAKTWSSGFSADVSALVYDGYSVTYSMLQIAVFMGFTEIYLLGTDCSYKKGEKQHFVESGHFDNNSSSAGLKMIKAYTYAKKYADKHNIKIFNATRGGMLEVFKRIKLEDVIQIKKLSNENHSSINV